MRYENRDGTRDRTTRVMGFRVSCNLLFLSEPLVQWRREGGTEIEECGGTLGGGIAEEERSDGARAVFVHATARRGAAHE